MADVTNFPNNELTADERAKLQELVEQELADINDTSCESSDKIHEQIMVLVEYIRKFISVVDDSDAIIHPDYDFSLALIEGRIKKIRGMLKSLFGD